jgi:hypothetical protein
MKRRSVLTLVLALALASLFPGYAAADSGSATYAYVVGAAPLCGLAPNACPDVAMAPNGDTLTISGSGILSIGPKTATGGGTFTHKTAAGAVFATGRWTATGLAGLHSYGSAAAQALPPNLFGGLAILKVHIITASGFEADGLLTITCTLGDQVPSSATEGVRLNVQDIINFNKEVSGFTVFVLLP